MPHHWQKMRMEEALFKSGMDFTILQPCAYMQNILSGWQKIIKGKYHCPLPGLLPGSVWLILRMLVKLLQKVLTEKGYANAIFELAGPEPLTQVEVSKPNE